ncbi:SCP2 sterol-binding domain-containing protein [Candidatus Poriferisodalis sp.]|uniref:SCP2 sterol-binding domain-containing protein n=1 Tax=Candidatus Poriferisodalis sp. TaxID=3101277 RepID=UPI003B024291
MDFLDEEYLAQWAAGRDGALAGVSGTVVLKAVGGPDGNAAVTLIFEAGVVTSAKAGATRGADLTLEAPWRLAAEVVCGGGDPARHYMAGDLKVSGDMALWLQLLPAWRAAGSLAAPN